MINPRIRVSLLGSLAIEGEGVTARHYLVSAENQLIRLIYPPQSAPVKPCTGEIKVSGILTLSTRGLALKVS